MSAPLIFGIFLRGMRKNGGEGGSFNCGNVLAHCQSFFYFVKGQVIYHLVHRELWLLRFFGMTQTRQ